MLSRAQNTYHHNPRLRGPVSSDHRNYFMINRHESMGPGLDLTRDPGPGPAIGLASVARHVMPRSHIHGSPCRFYYGLNITDDP